MMVSRGRIKLTVSVEEWLDQAIHRTGLTLLEINPEIAVESCNLPGSFHKDPADRIIVATSRVRGIPLISKDQEILSYPSVDAVW